MGTKNLSFDIESAAPPRSSKWRFLAAARRLDSTAILQSMVIGLVILLAVGLRVWGLNRVGYNTDEAVYSGQAAAIAGDPSLKEIFPIFRAHPLLFQFILALVFHFRISDIGGRLVAVAIGLATVYLLYCLGNLLYGKKAGMLAALILALMPYHVVVTRQVLLDGPLVFCSTLTLYLLVRFAFTGRPVWLYATGIGMGLTVLAKETGIILMAAIYGFLALSHEIRIRIINIVIATILTFLLIAPFPLSLLLAGGTKSGKQYLVWQLFRRPNHTWDFYLSTVPVAVGLLVVAAALLGLWMLRKEHTWRERLLLCWILVPICFFQLWPTKGYQYLLPIAPPIAALAGRFLARWPSGKDIRFQKRRLNVAWVRGLITGIVAVSLLIPSWQLIQPSTTGAFLAGTGGVPGGRETGLWVQKNLPQGAILLTIGPSMANILQFYGQRKAYGLSISPNPLHRNPSYEPINNPDLQIRNSDLQYLVWDSFSAGRSSFFSEGLLKLVKQYDGQIIHTESVMVKDPDGKLVAKPIIVIYEVHP